jgi:14-3-3 protein epsilon
MMRRQELKAYRPEMTTDRDVCLSLIQLLEQAGRHQDITELMKRAISLDPNLTPDERNLLSVTYKSLISGRRTAIRSLSALLEQPITKSNQSRIDQVSTLRTTIIAELDEYSLDLINLIDTTLLSIATEPEARLFYEKLKADYWRYMTEHKEGDEKAKFADETKQAYERALTIAKDEIPPYKPASLGLMLNYSVFLYEILRRQDEAIELARKTFNECENALSNNSEGGYEEAATILQLLRDNVELWGQSGKS